MDKLIFHVDVNSAFIAEAVYRYVLGEKGLRDIPSAVAEM